MHSVKRLIYQEDIAILLITIKEEEGEEKEGEEEK
jgi:hypothetical protein